MTVLPPLDDAEVIKAQKINFWQRVGIILRDDVTCLLVTGHFFFPFWGQDSLTTPLALTPSSPVGQPPIYTYVNTLPGLDIIII